MEKLSEFIFDIMGLFLPGLLLCMYLLTLPLCMINYSEAEQELPKVYNFLLNVNNLKIPPYVIIFVSIFIFYLVGHAIKVFSKFFYTICPFIMDKFLLKPIIIFKKYLDKKETKNKLLSYFKELICKVMGIFLEMVTFSVESYSSSFEQMKKISKIKLYKEYNMSFFKENDSWYPFYKSALKIANDKNVKTHANFFLAKYNFYRSVAFIFLIHILIVIPLINDANKGSIIASYSYYILLFDILFWITFHTKYKRYWSACGTEAIIGLYHSLYSFKDEKKIDSLQTSYNLSKMTYKKHTQKQLTKGDYCEMDKTNNT